MCVYILRRIGWQLTILEKVKKLYVFFDVTLRKNVTSYVKSEGRLQRRHSIGNVVQPTTSLYDFRLKSYGTLYDFYKNGDLDLDLNPNFTKKLCQGTWTRVHQLYKFQKDRTSIVACRAFKDGQTDRQTDRPRWPIYFAKIYDFAK